MTFVSSMTSTAFEQLRTAHLEDARSALATGASPNVRVATSVDGAIKTLEAYVRKIGTEHRKLLGYPTLSATVAIAVHRLVVDREFDLVMAGAQAALEHQSAVITNDDVSLAELDRARALRTAILGAHLAYQSFVLEPFSRNILH